jgi:anti-sigma regulatory factor (Ser/Thr protein kinase)
MGRVTIQLPPAPDQVRTARLFAVTMARRAGVAEPLLDEVRLAVGEACARAVQLHIAQGITATVGVELTDDSGFQVVVVDAATGAPGDTDPAAIGLAILSAVVDDVEVRQLVPRGTRVRMRWPRA